MMDRWDMMNGWNGTAELTMLVGILVVAIVVLIGFWLITRSTQGAHPVGPTAMDILRERYARGEITKDEFETARRTLGG